MCCSSFLKWQLQMIATFPQCLFMDIHATHHPLHVHRQVILMKLTLFSQNLSFMSSCRHSITVPLFIFRYIVWSIYWTSSGNVSRKSRMYAQSHIMGNILGTNFIWINTRSWQCLVWHVSLPLMGTAERMWGEIACGIKNNTRHSCYKNISNGINYILHLKDFARTLWN